MDIVDEIVKNISEQYDNDLIKMFSQYGFSREYLIKHADEFLIIEHGNVKRYIHKDKELFDEITRIEFSEDGFKINYVTEFIPLT